MSGVGWLPNVPDWWNGLAAAADDAASRYSAAWYERFADLYDALPGADDCSRENLRMLADSAALREANERAGVRWRGREAAELLAAEHRTGE